MTTIESTAGSGIGHVEGGNASGLEDSTQTSPGPLYGRAYLLSINHFDRALLISLDRLGAILISEVERLTLGVTQALKTHRFADAESLCNRASKILATQECVNRLSAAWQIPTGHPLVAYTRTLSQPVLSERSSPSPFTDVRRMLTGMLQEVNSLVRVLSYFEAGCLEAGDRVLAQHVCSYADQVACFRRKLWTALKEDESIDLRL